VSESYPLHSKLASTDEFSLHSGLVSFSPLKSCHQKLSEAKRKAQAEIGEELAALLDSKGNATMTNVASGVTDMKKLIVSVAEERVRSILEWPLDTSTLGRFTVTLVSISGH